MTSNGHEYRETNRQFVGPTFLHQFVLHIKYLPDGPRDDPALAVVLLNAGAALHGERLAAASLTVREHADVVAVQSRLRREKLQT